MSSVYGQRQVLAIDRRGAGEDEPLHPRVSRRKKHPERSGGVHLVRGERVLGRTFHRAEGGLVEHEVHPLQSGGVVGVVPDVAVDHLEPRGVPPDGIPYRLDVLAAAGREVVEDPHLHPLPEETLGEMRSDESGAARDERRAGTQVHSMSYRRKM
jgi:hypothetical protein